MVNSTLPSFFQPPTRLALRKNAILPGFFLDSGMTLLFLTRVTNGGLFQTIGLMYTCLHNVYTYLYNEQSTKNLPPIWLLTFSFLRNWNRHEMMCQGQKSSKTGNGHPNFNRESPTRLMTIYHREITGSLEPSTYVN